MFRASGLRTMCAGADDSPSNYHASMVYGQTGGFERAIKWDEHLARPRNARYWAAKLRSYHDRDWFILRRSSFAPSVAGRESLACSTAGRTDTMADSKSMRDGMMVSSTPVIGEIVLESSERW